MKTKKTRTSRSLKRMVRRRGLDNEIRASLDEQRLELAMAALHDIADMPRAGRAARLARAVVRFIENVKPVSFCVSMVKPPNESSSVTRHTERNKCKPQ